MSKRGVNGKGPVLFRGTPGGGGCRIKSMPGFQLWWVLLLLPLAPWPALRRLERPRPRVLLLGRFSSRVIRLDTLRKPWSFWLWTGSVAALVVALAGPTTRPVSLFPGAVQVLLDASGSMAEVDQVTGRSRWEIATQAVGALAQALEAQPETRRLSMGLLLFASRPSRVLPPGTHPGALPGVLEAQQVSQTPGETTTNLGAALIAGLDELAATPPGSQRVLLLVSDGEHNTLETGAPDDPTPRQAAQLAATLGVRLLVLRVPAGQCDESAQKQGEWLLQDLASRTGGMEFSLPLESPLPMMKALGMSPAWWLDWVAPLPWRALLAGMSVFLAGGAWLAERIFEPSGNPLPARRKQL